MIQDFGTNNIGHLPREFDLVVVGAGVLGAMLFNLASQLNLRVLLCEKGDFASGTSSNSLKTIHGGIRYLQKAQFSRVLESSAERYNLLKSADHLVQPLSCLMPAQNLTTKSALAYWAGALGYNLLACRTLGNETVKGRVERASIIHIQRQEKRLSLPFRKKSSYALHWQDAQVENSERLITDIILSAESSYALALNYHCVEALKSGQSGIELTLLNRTQGGSTTVRAKQVIDASGCWNWAESIPGIPPGLSEARVKAVNIVMNFDLGKHALALPAFDERIGKRRMLFMSPWLGKTLCGTWYFECQSEPDSLVLNVDELEICLEQIRAALSETKHNISLSDLQAAIIDVHLGYLPAKNPKTNAPLENRLIEKEKIITSEDHGIKGLTIVKINKYTTARKVAERVLKKLNLIVQGSSCEELVLRKTLIDRSDKFQRLSVSERGRLERYYGAGIAEIDDMISQNPGLGACIPGTEDYLQAEFVYCVRHEKVKTVSDFIYRRTNIGTSALVSDQCLEWCLCKIGDLTGISEQEKEHQRQSVHIREAKRRYYRTVSLRWKNIES